MNNLHENNVTSISSIFNLLLSSSGDWDKNLLEDLPVGSRPDGAPDWPDLPDFDGTDLPGFPDYGDTDPDDRVPGATDPDTGAPGIGDPGQHGLPKQTPGAPGQLDGTGPDDATPDLLAGLKHVASAGNTQGTGGGNTPPKGSHGNPYGAGERDVWQKHGGWFEDPSSIIYKDPLLPHDKQFGPSSLPPGQWFLVPGNASKNQKSFGLMLHEETLDYIWSTVEKGVMKDAKTKANKDSAEQMKKLKSWLEDVDKTFGTSDPDKKKPEGQKDEKKPEANPKNPGEKPGEGDGKGDENGGEKDDPRSGGTKSGGEKSGDTKPGDSSDEAGTTTNPDDDTPPPPTEQEAKDIVKKAVGLPGQVITWVDDLQFEDVDVPEDPDDFIDAVTGDAPMDPDGESPAIDPNDSLPAPGDFFDPLINPGYPEDLIA